MLSINIERIGVNSKLIPTMTNTKKKKKKKKKKNTHTHTHTHTHKTQDKSYNRGFNQQLIYLIY